jgi:hypothetical protein
MALMREMHQQLLTLQDLLDRKANAVNAERKVPMVWQVHQDLQAQLVQPDLRVQLVQQEVVQLEQQVHRDLREALEQMVQQVHVERQELLVHLK